MNRLRLLALVLVTAACGAAAAGAAAAPSLAGCTVRGGSPDPVVSAIAFIHFAIERTDPGRGFRYVIRSARHGTTCADWANGRVPFRAFRGVDWRRARYAPIAAGEGQFVYRVTLPSARGTGVFLCEVQEEDGLWKVGYWAPEARPPADRVATLLSA